MLLSMSAPRGLKMGLVFGMFLLCLGTFLSVNMRKDYVDCQDTGDAQWEMDTSHNCSVFVDAANVDIVAVDEKICENVTDYAVAVHSAPGNQELRNAIRSTWGNRSLHGIPVVFMIGLTTNETITRLVNEEFIEYGDVVIGNFLDSYRQMTWKHLMALKWSVNHCPSAKYLLKFDDDVIVQLKRLVPYLDKVEQKLNTSSIFCDFVESAVVQRSKSSKWRVTKEQYGKSKYPTYCNGYAIAYPSAIIDLLLNVSARTPYFWIDDVFFTGFLAEEAGVPRVGGKIFISPTDQLLTNTVLEPRYSGKSKRVFQMKLIGPVEVHNPSEVFRLWQLVPD